MRQDESPGQEGRAAERGRCLFYSRLPPVNCMASQKLPHFPNSAPFRYRRAPGERPPFPFTIHGFPTSQVKARVSLSTMTRSTLSLRLPRFFFFTAP